MNTEKNIKTLIVKKPLKLDCGKTIKDFPIAYETYGSLNSKKDNAILVFHALTGDQFVTGINPVTNKDGWRKVCRELFLITLLQKFFLLDGEVGLWG